jgi:hypothetical protein
MDEQTLAVKLEEAEKIIRRLRRENEESRREVSVTECLVCFQYIVKNFVCTGKHSVQCNLEQCTT